MSIIIEKEFKEKLVEYYKQKPITISQISKIFKISIPTVYKILKEYNIEIYKRHQIYNDGLIENYFENIDSPNKAYLLGLLITDGCVFTPKQGTPRIMLQLSKKDKDMVDAFKEEHKAPRKITIGKRDNSSSISITSRKMALDLSKYGVIPHKTFCTIFPDIDKRFYPDFIRGVFDGDGSLVVRKNGRRDFCICGTYELLNSIKQILVKELNVKDIKVSKEDTIYTMRWGSKTDIIKICDWIYSTDSSLYLKRKKEIYLSIKNS